MTQIVTYEEVNSRTRMIVKDLVLGVPAGVILMWSGSVASIPAGFALCNGVNGTPDLRGRFIYGAGGLLNPGEAGGATSQSHTPTGSNANENAHTHAAGTLAVANHTRVTSRQGTSAGNVVTTETHAVSGSTAVGAAHTHAFTGNAANIPTLPPYYALAYIMKL